MQPSPNPRPHERKWVHSQAPYQCDWPKCNNRTFQLYGDMVACPEHLWQMRSNMFMYGQALPHQAEYCGVCRGHSDCPTTLLHTFYVLNTDIP